MNVPPWTIDEINRWSREEFVERLGFLFERSPWVVETAWSDHPFSSNDDLHRAFTSAIAQSGESRQLALIRSHPDLVGRAALAGTLTRESTSEQRGAGLDPGRLSPVEIARFSELNDAYKSRFGFPFVICVRENTKATILNGFVARLGNDTHDEIVTALAEVAKISRFRLADVVVGDDSQRA